MSDNEGLKAKYAVFKIEDGSRVKNCFVLRPGRDPAARAALLAYVRDTPNALLGLEIKDWLIRLDDDDDAPMLVGEGS